jgi:hypothetical protein
LLTLVVAVASAQTGTVEKVALIAAGAALVWLASRVRRIGAPVRRRSAEPLAEGRDFHGPAVCSDPRTLGRA